MSSAHLTFDEYFKYLFVNVNFLESPCSKKLQTVLISGFRLIKQHLHSNGFKDLAKTATSGYSRVNVNFIL